MLHIEQMVQSILDVEYKSAQPGKLTTLSLFLFILSVLFVSFSIWNIQYLSLYVFLSSTTSNLSLNGVSDEFSDLELERFLAVVKMA